MNRKRETWGEQKETKRERKREKIEAETRTRKLGMKEIGETQ